MAAGPPILALYLFEGCPWCERVRAAVDDLELKVVERDVRRDPTHAAALAQATGRKTVPVLLIEGDGPPRWLPESADIVDFLYGEFGGGRPRAFLASPLPQAIGAVVAACLFVGGVAAGEPIRTWMFIAAALLLVLRNQLPLVRRWLPRRR